MTMLFSICLALISQAFSADSSEYRNADLQLNLVSLQERWDPKDELELGIYFKLQPGWHVYWKNPGGIGKATEVQWQGHGLEFGETLFPVPQVIDSKLFKSLGYSDRTLIRVKARSSQIDPTQGQVMVQADVAWGLCRESCIPGRAKLQVTVPLSGGGSIRSKNWTAVFDEFARQTPRDFNANFPGASVFAQTSEQKLTIDFSGVEVQQLWMATNDLVDQPMNPVAENGGRLVFDRIPTTGKPKNVDLLVGIKRGDLQYYQVQAPLHSQSMMSREFFWAILFAFLGGLILNIMPCVFPVLLLKVYALVRDSELGVVHRLRGALGSLVGIVIGFLSFALIMALTQVGQGSGWGFQMQSPSFVLALILLVHLVALQFAGLWSFQLPSLATQNPVTDRLIKSSSSIASGLLLVLLSTPCTAPFMGGALAYGLSQGTAALLAIFVALALGLSAPLVLLAAAPGLARLLPKPGAWLERFKQFLAFPMWATLIWLVWVLGTQTGLDGVVLALVLVTALGFAAWMLRDRTPLWLLAAVVALMVYGMFSLQSISQMQIRNSIWQPYTDQKLMELRAAKKGVFIDFTASWCITCQINKKTTLERKEVLQLFQSRGIVLLRADWTRQSPEITAALRRFGEVGVPHYVLYLPEASEPKILPKILTRSVVDSALQ